MNITVYDNFKKAVNSTKQPSGGRTISVRLKDNCSVVNPVFRLKSNDKDINYVKWDNNYYYVDNVEFLANEEIAVHCSRDALATFKSDIGGSTQYVARSAVEYDEYVQDMRYPAKATVSKTELIMNNTHDDLVKDDGGGYVLSTIAKDNASGTSHYYLTATEFHHLVNYMFSDSWLAAGNTIPQDLQKELINPIQYVVDCKQYPFLDRGAHSGHLDSVSFGFWDNTGCTGGLISDNDRTYTSRRQYHMPRHPQAATRGKYLNTSPYTRYTLDFYSLGQIPLDPSFFTDDDQITVDVKIDKYTGQAELDVYSSYATVIKQQFQFGIEVKLSQITNPIIAPAINAVGVAGKIAEKDFAGAVSGVGNLINSVMPQLHSTGNVASDVSYKKRPRITCEFFPIVDEDAVTIGRPLMKPKVISSLHGYMECSNVDLVTSATPSEKQQMIGYMEGGFFYE